MSDLFARARDFWNASGTTRKAAIVFGGAFLLMVTLGTLFGS